MVFPWARMCTAGLYSYGGRTEWIGGQLGVFHNLQQFSPPPHPPAPDHLLTVPVVCLMATPHTRPSSVPPYTATAYLPSLGIRVQNSILLVCQSGHSPPRLMLPLCPHHHPLPTGALCARILCSSPAPSLPYYVVPTAVETRPYFPILRKLLLIPLPPPALVLFFVPLHSKSPWEWAVPALHVASLCFSRRPPQAAFLPHHSVETSDKVTKDLRAVNLVITLPGIGLSSSAAPG